MKNLFFTVVLLAMTVCVSCGRRHNEFPERDLYDGNYEDVVEECVVEWEDSCAAAEEYVDSVAYF